MRTRMPSAPGETAVLALGSAAVVAGTFLVFWVSTRLSADQWRGATVAVALVAISVPIIHAVTKGAEDEKVRRLLYLALAVKILGTVVRYLVNTDLYAGRADAELYHLSAEIASRAMRHGVFSLEGTVIQPRPSTTQSVAWVLSAFYAVAGASRSAGYLFFGWVGWLGLICFYRAFRLAAPQHRGRPVVLTLFFLPSLVYWPSSPGKEALISLLLGLTTLGLCHLYYGANPSLGLTQTVVGLAGTFWIRPHVAALVLVAAAAGALATPARQQARNRTVRIAVICLVVPLFSVAMTRVGDVFGTERSGGDGSVESVLQRTADQTSTGGSQFEAQPVRSPLDLPSAAVSVLLRPFPWEAGSPVTLVASLEGVVIVGLLYRAGRRFRRLAGAVRRSHLLALSATFVVAFVIAFSNVFNAGILARQRSQVLPFLILLLVVQPPDRSAAPELPQTDDQRAPALKGVPTS